jgi:hypothetical protein
MMIYKAMSHVTLPHMRKLSPAPTLVAKNKQRFLSEQPLYNLELHSRLNHYNHEDEARKFLMTISKTTQCHNLLLSTTKA